MRTAKLCFAIGALAASSIACAGGLVEVIEVRRTLAPGEVIDFVFTDNAGGVTRQSVGDSDADGIISVQVPANSVSKAVHTSNCLTVTLENVLISSLQAAPQQGMIPMFFDDLSGFSVWPELSVLSINTLPAFSVGQTLSLNSGVSSLLPGTIVRAPGMAFPAIPDSGFATPGGFALFTGSARVVEMLDVRVYIIPSPGVAALLGIVGVMGARRRR